MSAGHAAFDTTTLFVLADGARARLVKRTPSGHFATFAEVDAREGLKRLRRELSASQPPVNLRSGAPVRHSVGQSDYIRQAKEQFVETVADEAVRAVQARGFEKVVLAAPARLIGPLREQFGDRARIAGSITRDLTKSADVDLPRWLDHIWE